MKKILIFILFFAFMSKAQSQMTIIDFDNYANDLDSQNYYMKDINNYLDQFEGTWKYINGNSEIELVFKKKTFTDHPNPSMTVMQDELVGECRYVKNGVEVLNTLQNIDVNHIMSVEYNISGGVRTSNDRGTIPCYMCTVPNQRLWVDYDESTNDNECLYGSVLIHTFVENGQTKLFFSIRKRLKEGFSCVKKSDDTQSATYFDLEIADGEYIFVKVP